MGDITINRNKRELDLQSGISYDNHQQHVNKKMFKPSSNWTSKTVELVKSSVSRLRFYPKHVTPISRDIQAPSPVIRGFTSNRINGIVNNCLGYDRRMDKGLFTERMRDYERTMEAVTSSCRFVKSEMKDEVVEVVNVVNGDNDGSGVSGVEGVVMVERERENLGDKSGEVRMIRVKYRVLDGKVASWREVSDGKPLINKEGVSLPIHKKLYNDSGKRDPNLRRLSFDNKLHEDNDGSGVEEVMIVEGEKNDGGDKSGEVRTIRAKYRELDGKAEGNVVFRESTSLGGVLDVLDRKALEWLSLKHREDASLPYHKKLYNDSGKRDPKEIELLNKAT